MVLSTTLQKTILFHTMELPFLRNCLLMLLKQGTVLRQRMYVIALCVLVFVQVLKGTVLLAKLYQEFWA